MANYATLKAAIQQVVKTNGNNEITGALLQQSLFAMINSLGNDYQFMGIATPSTNPGTPDENVAYIAGAGTYPNFDGAVVEDGNLAVLKYNGSWVIETLALRSSIISQELQIGKTSITQDNKTYDMVSRTPFCNSGSNAAKVDKAIAELYIPGFMDGDVLNAVNISSSLARVTINRNSANICWANISNPVVGVIYPVVQLNNSGVTGYIILRSIETLTLSNVNYPLNRKIVDLGANGQIASYLQKQTETNLASINNSLFPSPKKWTNKDNVNNVISEFYIPNAATVLGTGAKISTIAVTNTMLRLQIVTSSNVQLVWLTKKFTTYVTDVSDGSIDDYFNNNSIAVVYKDDGTVKKRIGYVKFRRSNFSGSSQNAVIDLDVVSDISNSPTIKKMVEDPRQIVLCGDSHLGAFQSVNFLVDMLQGITGIKVFNLGFGGCDMAWRSVDGSNNYDPLSFSSVVDALVSQTFTAQRNAVSLSSDYIHPEADLEAVDVTKPMQVLVEYGVNDHSGGIAIGEQWVDDGTFNPSNNTDVTNKLASLNRHTLLGALNYGLLKLFATYPKLVQIQVTGTARVVSETTDLQGRRMRSNKINSLGLTLDQYNDALRDNCKYTGVRYSDYPNCGIYNVFAMRFDNNGGTGITISGTIHNEPRGFGMMAQYWANMINVYYAKQ